MLSNVEFILDLCFFLKPPYFKYFISFTTANIEVSNGIVVVRLWVRLGQLSFSKTFAWVMGQKLRYFVSGSIFLTQSCTSSSQVYYFQCGCLKVTKSPKDFLRGKVKLSSFSHEKNEVFVLTEDGRTQPYIIFV